MAPVIEALVDGGKASAGPPLGPALGPLGLPIPKVIQAINEKTKDYAGMKVPVKITVDPKTKEFSIDVGTPPTSALILSEARIEKGSGTPKQAKVGNITVDQCVKVAEMKATDLSGGTLKARVKEVMGTAVSMGVTVEGKDGRETQAAVDAGKYDAKLNR